MRKIKLYIATSLNGKIARLDGDVQWLESLPNPDGVDHTSFLKQLKKKEGKDIWLIGGGQVNTMLLNEGLIDEAIIFVMPVVIPDGIEIFENKPVETRLELQSAKTYSTGAVELTYTL